MQAGAFTCGGDRGCERESCSTMFFFLFVVYTDSGGLYSTLVSDGGNLEYCNLQEV